MDRMLNRVQLNDDTGRSYGLASADTTRQTTEPVFGIIKSVMGFRQFLLRGLDCVRGESEIFPWIKYIGGRRRRPTHYW
jgi:hypothetical protein